MNTEPLPILVLSNHGDIIGGGELSLLDLLGSIDRSHWAPIVVVPSEGEVAKRCRALQIPTHVIRLPSLRWPRPALVTSLARLARLIRLTGAKLLHANGSRAMFYAGLAGRFASRPVIWHVRVADRDPLWDRFLVRFAQLIITNSHAVRARFRTLKEPDAQCVHNGVDLSRFYPRPPSDTLRHSLGLPEKGPVIMSLGRFVPYKGYQDLLEAAQSVNRRLPELHWLLAGDGELRETLQQRTAQLGLSGQVHFPGWRDDTSDLLALCDVFVMPSHGEHFGRVLIEAMAMAKPVVATSSGGVPEIVADGETGLLVPPGEPAALGRAISSLIQNPALADQLGRKGRSRVERLFSLESHVAAIETIYEKLLGRPHARV